MDSKSAPLVSIVTPVYNNADFLPACIESVLGQTYQNWDYTIVDNCSTDGSGDIARQYVAKDSRIKVRNNNAFLRAIASHNAALRQMSPQSKYCKMVFADDLIFPRCIEEMVAVAEEYPSVGIVGAYRLENDRIGEWRKGLAVWTGLPYPSTLVSGREICRRTFLEDISLFGTANSVLYRSDLVRGNDPFFNESNLHADQEVCAILLKDWDFGFVHQVLTFTRPRPGSLNTVAVDMQMELGCHLNTLVKHGRAFLTSEEFDSRLADHLADYYNFLAVSCIRRRRDKSFWEFHRRKLDEACGFSHYRLSVAIVKRLFRALLNPYETVEKLHIGRNHRNISGITRSRDKTARAF